MDDMKVLQGKRALEIDWDTVNSLEDVVKILKLLRITIDPGSQAEKDLAGYLKWVTLPPTAADLAKMV